MKNIPILGFVIRYWLLLLLLAGAVALVVNERLFQMLGTLIYLPAMVLAVVCVVLLVRHIFFAKTLDLDVHTGFFVESWAGLSARDRVMINLAVLGVLFLGACWIGAALVK